MALSDIRLRPRERPAGPRNSMTLFQITALIVTLAALASYANYRFLHLPPAIGLMLIPLVASLILILASKLGLHFDGYVRPVLEGINFSDALLNGMLSFLLFAGALHVDFASLREEKWPIAGLATFGVVVSTLLVAGMMFFVFAWLGMPVPFLICLTFGALISPTDPIAVLALLKHARAPRALGTRIAGESLFNDGVGIVFFVVCFEVLADTGAAKIDPLRILRLLAQEGVGGIAVGIALGYLTYWLLKSVDNYRVEVLITLALVTGGYALASALHTSGPLAIVAAGMVIGNHGRAFAMSDETRENLDAFWELIDEILNAVLFVLIGLEVLILPFERGYLYAGLVAIPVVLLARFLSVGATVTALRPWQNLGPHTIKILTWGGLRGGLSVALALSLPAYAHRDLLLTVTYVVVVFSIAVQGLTTPRLLGRLLAKPVQA